MFATNYSCFVFCFAQGSKINGVWTELEGACIEEDIQISTSYEMRDLQADTYYRIELMAHNAIGFSKPAHLLLKTARGESNNNLGSLYNVYSAGFGYPPASAAGRFASRPTEHVLLLFVYSVCSFVFVYRF